MKYNKTVILKNGAECLLRHGTEADGAALLDIFNRTHAETDFLLTYPGEENFSVDSERAYLREKAESSSEIEILAVVDGRIVGSAGIGAVGNKEKIRHRAELGISILRDFWSLGIGRALMEAAVECARKAGYVQMELDVVAENNRAVELYKSVGFEEYGRNPKGFRLRSGGFREIVHMRREL